MNIWIYCLAFAGIPAFANPVLVRETEPLSAEEELKALAVPEGFEIQLFASEPMINKPINLAWDQRGRLWVSSTVEYPYAAEKGRWSDPQGSKVRDSRDVIKILEDTDGDGRADKVIDFADHLNIPTGVLPWHKREHQDGCLAWSIPNIWYLADTNGDGKCDHREVLFGPMGYERDTHGMCSSFRFGHDGWVYATHGFNNVSKAVAKDGSSVEMSSGNVFRFQPDGSRIEVWSRGQVNPFGLCFDRRGNLYSADCHSAPVYQLLRGAVYPSFGKPHDGIGFGPTMIEHTHGSTGICGIVYLDRGIWGSEWNDHLFIGNPVNSCVNHDRIEFSGSTPRAVEQADFVTSKDPWFRPVDLCVGGDGALYIADFYNRIIGHYEVPLDHPGRDRERGRIWRVLKKKGVRKPGPMEIPQVGKDLVDALGHSSPFVRRAATAQLQQEPELRALEPLLRLYDETAKEDTHLRHAALMAIREHLKLPGAFENSLISDLLPLSVVLATPSAASAHFFLKRLEHNPRQKNLPAIMRHIARHGSEGGEIPSAISLARFARKGDPVGQTRLLQAMVEGQEERGVLNPHAKLLAWGQDLAMEILKTKGEAPWIMAPHPASPNDPSPWVLQKRDCQDGKRLVVISSLPKGRARTEVLTGILRSKAFPAPRKLSFWLCGHRGFPEESAHDKNLVRLVDAKTGEVMKRAFPPRNDRARRVEWDLSAIEGTSVRLEVIDGDRGEAYAWLGITRIEPSVVAVNDFEEKGGRDEALRSLAKLLRVVAPLELRNRLRAYLSAMPAPTPAPVSPEERKRLNKIIKERVASFAKSTPNPVKGRAVFANHCVLCHQINRKGGLLGPQLDGIGKRGVARLCEDILDPNRNVDAHFHLTTLTLKDGSDVMGFVRGESGAVLLLVDGAGREHRLQKSEIASQKTSARSLMPAPFDEILTDEQLNDLLGWLLEEK